jgi:large subunit ribosomal protein L29
MAKKKKEDIPLRELGPNELNQRLEKNKEDLFRLRFRAASVPAKNTMEVRNLRREIARLHTFLNIHKAESQSAPAAKSNRGNGREA